MKYLTPHFTLDELTHSETALRRGIDQTPPPAVLKALQLTASQMEVVRSLLGGKPIRITSGYRSPALNAAVGSKGASAHVTGHAVDFVCPAFGTPQEICRLLAKVPTLHFDQLIHEGTWVHISFAPQLRRDLLTAHFAPAGTTYTPGIA